MGAQAPEVPEAKDSFIVRERSGNLIQDGFEHSEKSTSESGCPSAQRGFFGDFRAVDLLGLSDSEKWRFPATSLEML